MNKQDAKYGRWSHLITAVGFLLFLWLPVIGTALSIGVSEKGFEKRELAKAPDLSELRSKGLSYFRNEFNNFFSDHFGFRKWMITSNNIIRYCLFKASSSKRVAVGADGWLYYTSAIKDFQTRHPYSRKTLDDIQRILEKRRDWLAARKIAYLFVVAPNKATIYPEYLPGYVKRLRPKSKLDQLMDHLKKKSTLQLVDLRSALNREKQANQVYYMTDTHWNDRGALVAYRQIMKTIREQFPSLHSLPDDKIRLDIQHDRTGDLAQILTLGGLETEDAPRITLAGGYCASQVPIGRGAYREVIAKERKDHDGPKLLVFGDSFVVDTPLHDFLAEHFRRSVFIRRGTRDFFDEEMVKKEKPDIVIQEMVERFLMAPFQENQFKQGEGQVLMKIGGGNGFAGLQIIRDVELDYLKNELLMKATGRDPHLQLPALRKEPKSELLVEIDIESPVDTTLQVFYLTRGERHYSEKYSVKKDIHEGRNEIRFSIHRKDVWGRLRLDPGGSAGLYRLYAMKVVRLE